MKTMADFGEVEEYELRDANDSRSEESVYPFIPTLLYPFASPQISSKYSGYVNATLDPLEG